MNRNMIYATNTKDAMDFGVVGLGNMYPIVTEQGLTYLQNLIIEYNLGKKISQNQLAELGTLLLTLYHELGNLTHEKIFNGIDNHFKKYSDKGKKILSNSIVSLHENGFIKMSLRHEPSYAGIQ